jgi:hypothetical protein
LPGEVFDTSTTGVVEIVMHHHRQPTDLACLGCVYHNTVDEQARQKHVAEAVGVTVEDVETLFVAELAAEKICQRYSQLKSSEIIGLSYDSLFKELCSQAALSTPTQRRVLAPFAFVSALAGVLLVVDFSRRLSGENVKYNYWRLNPWAPPVSPLPHCVKSVEALFFGRSGTTSGPLATLIAKKFRYQPISKLFTCTIQEQALAVILSLTYTQGRI